MKPTTREKIIQIFRENGGYAYTADIREKGIHHVYLQHLVNEGTVTKIKHGLYALAENTPNSLVEASLCVSNGVICLGSALAFYQLTTWDPPAVHMAIPRSQKSTIADYPPIKLHYFSGRYYHTGIVSITIENHGSIQIYDQEKTLCDIVRFRNKIGIDIMKEALSEYLSGGDRNINKLVTYAETLGITSVLNQYLEVLL